jgi:hypothetical protein
MQKDLMTIAMFSPEHFSGIVWFVLPTKWQVGDCRSKLSSERFHFLSKGKKKKKTMKMTYLLLPLLLRFVSLSNRNKKSKRQ